MRVVEPIKEQAIASTIATALGKLDSAITAADVTVTINNELPDVSDTPLGYEHVRIRLSHRASKFGGELQRALKQLTGEAVTKSWTGDAVFYHAPLDDLIGLTPKMLEVQWEMIPSAPGPYRGA